VQIYARQDEAPAFNAAYHAELPVVGSPEYVARYGSGSRQAPSFSAGFAREERIQVAGFNASDLTGNVFVPAEATRIDVPPEAHPFISEEEAQAKAADPMRDWNDPHSREWTEYLLRQYHAFYPDVTYQLDWADDTVNAFAWVDNGVRHVAIKGGLVRHVSLEMEAIALVIAHETGHHYGGPPTYPDGLSCEGQADYSGALWIMRGVWFGSFYLTMMVPAIAQMANFFGVPNDPTPPGGSAGCQHPAGACRIATYWAGIGLTHIGMTVGGNATALRSLSPVTVSLWANSCTRPRGLRWGYGKALRRWALPSCRICGMPSWRCTVCVTTAATPFMPGCTGCRCPSTASTARCCSYPGIVPTCTSLSGR